MSAGRPAEGAGCVSWWGCSPAANLLAAGPVRQKRELNLLLVGSGDPRHVLKTVGGLRDEDGLHVWLMESGVEVTARQMLLLYLALVPQEHMGPNEKTEVFLEVFGNAEIRSQTNETLKRAAEQLLRSVTDAPEGHNTHPCLNTSLLKFKERDELTRIFQSWRQAECGPSLVMSKAWDYRVRQHLGTRYDSRRGCFDWDLTMKLHEKGGGVIDKHQYVRWRERGLAFEMREGVYQTTNPSLLSLKVFRQRGDTVGVRGYWGDIVSSPYLAFGIETDDESLLKKQNGRHVQTAQDISFANVQRLFQLLSSRRVGSGGPDARADDDTAEKCTDAKPLAVADLMHLDRISINFLPLDSLRKLPEKQKFSHLFDTIYFSASSTQSLGPALRQIAAPDAVLVVELAKYFLDLNKEQEAGFAEKVASVSREAGFEPCQETKSDDVHAVFVPTRK